MRAQIFGVSGFEMTQNAQKMSWSAEAVDEKLKNLMEVIYMQLDPSGVLGRIGITRRR